MRIHHRQQRRREQESPERKHEAEDEWDENRRPHGHSRNTAHDIGLEQEPIDHDDHRIKNDHVERMLPVLPTEGGGEDRAKQSEDGAEVRDDLQHGG